MLKALSIPRIRKAILFTVLILYVYLIGRALTVPGVNVESLYAGVSSTPVFALMNLISGGGLERLSLFSLGGCYYSINRVEKRRYKRSRETK